MLTTEPCRQQNGATETDQSATKANPVEMPQRYIPTSQDDVMTADQCASWLQITPTTLEIEVNATRIPAFKLGDQLRFHGRSVLMALNSLSDQKSIQKKTQPIAENCESACENNHASYGGTPSVKTAISGSKSNIDRINVNIWLSVKEAARKLAVSSDTIERRAIPWQDKLEPHKVRFKMLALDKGSEPTRRYFESDLEAMVFEPNRLPMESKRRLVPKFIKRNN